MKPRAIFFDVAMCLLWILLYSYYSRTISFDIILIGPGVIFGFGLGILTALRQTTTLEIKGEFKVTLKTWVLFLLTSVLVMFCLVSLIFIYGPKVGIPLVSFLVPAVPTIYATKIIFFLRWERKNKMLILYDSHDLNRIYAVPRNS